MLRERKVASTLSRSTRGARPVRHNGGAAKVCALNWRSGERRLLADLIPHDPTGVLGVTAIGVSADGKTIVYGLSREVSERYLAKPAK